MKSPRLIAATIVLALSAGCASTRIVDTWTVPEAAPQPHRALVVAVMPDEATRRNLEEHLAAELHEQGVDAVPSLQFLPDLSTYQRDQLRDAVHDVAVQRGFDTVIVSRYHGVATEYRYVPSSYGWYDYWAYPNPWVYSPGYLDTRTLARIETSAFDPRSGRLIWTATSETVQTSPGSRLPVGSVASRVVKAMKKDGVIGPS
ncbi:MAG: DUF4136 domain-containing protein [Myxococcaceae bacterium]|nr:DUF4136 domain-containing protein [Myxococcaceae bacterium]